MDKISVIARNVDWFQECIRMQIIYCMLLCICSHFIYFSAIIKFQSSLTVFEKPKDKFLFPEADPGTKLGDKSFKASTFCCLLRSLLFCRVAASKSLYLINDSSYIIQPDTMSPWSWCQRSYLLLLETLYKGPPRWPNSLGLLCTHYIVNSFNLQVHVCCNITCTQRQLQNMHVVYISCTLNKTLQLNIYTFICTIPCNYYKPFRN
jgi:hypothetical protein